MFVVLQREIGLHSSAADDGKQEPGSPTGLSTSWLYPSVDAVPQITVLERREFEGQVLFNSCSTALPQNGHLFSPFTTAERLTPHINKNRFVKTFTFIRQERIQPYCNPVNGATIFQNTWVATRPRSNRAACSLEAKVHD